MPVLLRLYGLLTALAAPLIRSRITSKLTAQGITGVRARERLGHATKARPAGRLIWFHGASVGETLSILPLIAPLQQAHIDVTILVTSGTAASAKILDQRLPDGVIHQFAPIDTMAALRRFHRTWRPDLAVLIESELWPNMIRSCRDRNVPLVLLNARLSDRSLGRWSKLGAPTRWIFGAFDLIVSQTDATARNLAQLGAINVRPGANLKAANPAPPDAPAQRAALATALAGRPVWLAASTHAGEDDIVLDAHLQVRKQHPQACLILAPRHVERASDIPRLCDARGLTVSLRSRSDPPETDVYLADTLGEMGLFYRLAPVTFIAGSFVPVGGHNPWEAACGTAILHGPLVANCAADYAELDAADGAVQIAPDTLGATVARLLGDPGAAQALAQAAIACKTDLGDETQVLAAELLSLLKDGS